MYLGCVPKSRIFRKFESGKPGCNLAMQLLHWRKLLGGVAAADSTGEWSNGENACRTHRDSRTKAELD
jgi:hypothetical protein